MDHACPHRASLVARPALPRAAVAVALLLSLWSERALAQLAWHPAERCAEARDALPPVMDQAAPPSIEVHVAGAAGNWSATLRVRYANGSGGERHIAARSCEELGRAVSVTLSLLDAAAAPPEPSVTTTAAEPAPRTGAAHEPVVAAPPEPTPALAAPARAGAASSTQDAPRATPAHSTPRPLTGFVRASSLLAIAGGRFGELGAALASGGWLGPWGMQLELSARRPLTELRTAHDFRLELERYAIRLEPCARAVGALELAVCLGPRLELLRGLALGPSQPARDVVWLPGVGGGARLRLPVSDAWALSAELSASWSARRAQASVAPWGKVYELPRLGAGLLLGAEWAL